MPASARAVCTKGRDVINGSWLVRLCFPALFFYVGLRLPVLFCVPFLVSDLACLVCTVQIKVVSLFQSHWHDCFRRCMRHDAPAPESLSSRRGFKLGSSFLWCHIRCWPVSLHYPLFAIRGPQLECHVPSGTSLPHLVRTNPKCSRWFAFHRMRDPDSSVTCCIVLQDIRKYEQLRSTILFNDYTPTVTP